MAMSTGRVVALIKAMGGGADPAVIEAAVQDWLDNHPEATTTVQDGSITEQKLATSIAQKLGLISSLSDEKAPVIYNNAEGRIASFCDGAAMHVKKLTIKITPEQSGSGDPSPDNIRPITGFSGFRLVGLGKNVLDPNIKFTAGTYQGVVVSTDDGYRVTRIGTATDSNNIASNTISKANAIILPPGTYTSVGALLGLHKANGTFLSNKQVGTWTVEEPFYVAYAYLQMISGHTYNDTTTMYLLYGAVSEEFETPVKNTDLNIDFGQTVYGGEMDVITGKLTITDANIASYAGETLPGVWISDRDVYAAGTSPTTGAQVVYKLATPTVVQLNGNNVSTLYGGNNLFTNIGDISVIYAADTKLYGSNEYKYLYYDVSFANVIASATKTDCYSLSEKRVNFLGDSMTALGNSYIARYVSDKLGCTGVNCGVSGSAITKSENEVYASFVTRLQNNLYTDADVWVIWGGYNDTDSPIGSINDTSVYTLYGALRYIIETLQAKVNMPSIILIGPAMSNRYSPHYSEMVYAMQKIAGLYGVPFLDLLHKSGVSSVNLKTLTSDSLHLNELGRNMVYPKITNFISENV